MILCPPPFKTWGMGHVPLSPPKWRPCFPGALPYVGGYWLPIISPLFYAELTQRPLFFYIWRIWQKFVKSCAFCTYLDHFKRILSQFFIKICKLWLEIVFLHTWWPKFLGAHSIKDPLFEPTPNERPPFFNERKHPTFAHVRHFHVWVTPLPRMLQLILEYKIIQSWRWGNMS